jgi:sugar phosphate isomerase/epimerase
VLQLCAFADEISPDLGEQIRVCRACGVGRVELRSVDNVNVLDFDRARRSRVREALEDAGMSVACIGSPIGKVKITEPWEPYFERFKIAVELAEFFGARMIRIFSYYPADDGDDIQRHRDEVMRRMRAKVDYIGARDVVLVHENESRIFGERGAACLDLMRAIDSPKLRSAFDFANFIVGPGERPRDNWPTLKPYAAHFHIKDARLGDRKIVPAGEGDGDIGPILADAYRSGYRGLLSLEPHLAAAGQFSGFSGPQLFTRAVEALRDVCREHGVPLEGN